MGHCLKLFSHIYTQINKSRTFDFSVTLMYHQFQILLEKFLNLGECHFQFMCPNFSDSHVPLAIYFMFVSLTSSLTGDDRNIVEVFVAGRKVVPITEPTPE